MPPPLWMWGDLIIDVIHREDGAILRNRVTRNSGLHPPSVLHNHILLLLRVLSEFRDWWFPSPVGPPGHMVIISQEELYVRFLQDLLDSFRTEHLLKTANPISHL